MCFPVAITLQSERNNTFCYSADANQPTLARSFGVEIKNKWMNTERKQQPNGKCCKLCKPPIVLRFSNSVMCLQSVNFHKYNSSFTDKCNQIYGSWDRFSCWCHRGHWHHNNSSAGLLINSQPYKYQPHLLHMGKPTKEKGKLKLNISTRCWKRARRRILVLKHKHK